MLIKRFSVIIALSFSILLGQAHAEFKKLSSDEWSKILAEIGINPEQSILARLTNAGDTIERIQSQTKANLRADNWVSIFKKLNAEPKPEMKPEEWAALFDKIGLSYKQISYAIQSGTSARDTTDSQPPQQTQTVQTASQEPATTAKTEMQAPAQYAKPEPQSQEKEKSTKISLDLRDADIFNALKIISQKAGLSIVAASNVKGSVSIYLQNTDALDALKMILEMNNLAYVRDGNIFKVMTDQDYERVYGKKFYDITAAEIVKLTYAKVPNIEKAIMPLKSKVGQIIPDPGTNSFIVVDTQENIYLVKKMIANLDLQTEVKVFALNYAKPKDVLEKIKNYSSPGTGAVQLDERTSQIIVTDFPEKVAEISKIIASLDKKNREVIIEARIVQVILGNDFKMGVNWESVFSQVNNRQISGNVSANLNALNLGASGIRLNVGTLAIDNFTALYDVLQTVGKTNLVSSPKIATIENQEAKILVGTKEAYVTTTVTSPGSGISTTAESITFIDVGVKLFVTPTIGDDGYITMKIRPEVSSVDRTMTTSQGNTIPIVRTSESETTVMVKDGVTIVIGGLMEERKEKQVSGIPLLSRIPLIGSLFGRTSEVTTKTELAVLLTPHIISGDVAVSASEKKRLKIVDK
ncbi:MAG: hypothetical protein A2204_00075 [Elusimicrobia bacterium RIFOXYA1_FULL_47_7]|nr:MAG: hypothetical protein A2204_00075 [Elusimicrobia bacterium RIFOXYA1_FULL_47_7]OGS15757.1 MAG: hypothetical protein A2251_08725 [Elusimicrobia bacterium RIFOXYA2_FULL_47_53]OGS31058.1 MAG: hypothetical protein A2323_07045 [Elusimicrobia bacterium RIFOXYB2_FULL_46_23]